MINGQIFDSRYIFGTNTLASCSSQRFALQPAQTSLASLSKIWKLAANELSTWGCEASELESLSPETEVGAHLFLLIPFLERLLG